MLKKALYFIKYNNAAVLILAFIFIFGAGAFAQTETGQEIIGEKGRRTEGIDNTLLLEADLDNFDMEHKIESVEKDENYYYVVYTFLDLELDNSAWQYQIKEKTRKVPVSFKQDLGLYLAEEMEEERFARIKALKEEKDKATVQGVRTRTEVEEYSGLIGQTLEVVGRVWPGYSPVKTRQIPSPEPAKLAELPRPDAESPADDLTEVYAEYMAENDPDEDNVFGSADNCPFAYNPEQGDADGNGVGDACETDGSAGPADEPSASEEEIQTSEDISGGTEDLTPDPVTGVEGEDGAAESPIETAAEEEVEVVEL